MARRALLLGLLLAWLGPGAARAGSVVGRVELAVAGAQLGALGPVVAFLEPVGAAPARAERLPDARIVQSNAQFVPDFLVVSVGQRIQMPNEDAIFHNVFSFSKPNDFDLGLYPRGASPSVRFDHPGAVRIYCSIHDSMSGLIVVAPSRWFATLDASGRFAIRDVPPGEYQLTVWNEMLPAERRRVRVAGAGEVRADVALGAAPP